MTKILGTLLIAGMLIAPSAMAKTQHHQNVNVGGSPPNVDIVVSATDILVDPRDFDEEGIAINTLILTNDSNTDNYIRATLIIPDAYVTVELVLDTDFMLEDEVQTLTIVTTLIDPEVADYTFSYTLEISAKLRPW